jgi:hypothetical protein
MQLPQEQQPWRGLALEQNEDHGKIVFLHTAVERLVVLDDLPRADALFANEQDKGRCLGDRAGKLRQPQATRPQAL